jgi:hypothetical protein
VKNAIKVGISYFVHIATWLGIALAWKSQVCYNQKHSAFWKTTMLIGRALSACLKQKGDTLLKPLSIWLGVQTQASAQ